MDPKSRAGIVFLLVIVLASITAAPAGAQGIFTVQAGSTTTPPLVSRNETWNFFKPTNNTPPITNWQSIADASLPATWGSGPGGFGYGDPFPAGVELTRSTT